MARGPWKTTLLKKQIRQAMLEAEAIKLASITIEQKIHEKKSLLDSARQHIGKLIDNVEALDLVTFLGLYLFYSTVNKREMVHAFIDSAMDFALLRTKSEAGTIAVLTHLAWDTFDAQILENLGTIGNTPSENKPGDTVIPVFGRVSDIWKTDDLRAIINTLFPNWGGSSPGDLTKPQFPP